jgi:autotransporter-associated beta strand protein
VLIGNATNTSAIFSGSLAINRTPGSTRQNLLFASNDGSVEFSGPISGSAAIGIGGGVQTLAGLPDGGRLGSVVLSGNNSGFSGDIAIQTRARLVVASNNALGTGTSPVALYSFGSNTSGTYVGGVSTRGAVTVSRDLLLNGTNTTISQPVSFLGTSADASVFTGRITINRGVSGGVPEQSFGAVAGGSVDFQGVITGTGVIAVPIVKTGEGLVIFSATNNYRGTTTINAGVLRGSDGVGISGSNVILAGGVWESATSVTRGLGTGANQVQLTNANSGSSGFSSANAAGMTVAIGGTAAPTALTWGDFGFTMNTLVLNAPTAAGTLEFRNSINLNADARTISVGANRATVSGTISNGALVKTGAGALVLTASNSYAFGTTINAGRLEIAPTGRINASSGVTIDGVGAELRYNGSAALTAPITFTRGTISGTGTIGTAVTVAANNVISPGNSPGIQAYTSGLTMASGGSYLWEINGWNGTAGNEADGFDQIAVSGSPLVISANSGSRFTIAITGLSGTAAGVVPNFSSATTTGTSFTIATSAAGISGFAANKFTLDTSAFTNNNPLPANAGFWIGQVGNDLILNYSPSARYTLTGSAAATVIRTTGSTTLTATITSATTAVTNPDSLGYRGLALSGAGALSSTSGTIAGGASGSGSVSFSSGSAGVFTFTPSITSGTNVNVGTAAIASATSGVSVTVYNPAAANTLTGSSFGTVLRDTALAQTLLITNTAAPGGFTERLDASFGSLSSLATTNSGSISLLAAGSTSTAMVVYLSTAAAGLASGTAQVSFTSNGDGTSGLAPLALTPQTVILSATVLDPAVASFSNGAQASLLIDFGSVMQLSAGPTEGFEIWNLLQTAGYTADLALLSFSETGDTSVLTTDLPASFTDLGPNGYFSYMASFADTSTLGAFESIYTLRFKSANGGVVFEGDSEQILTLTLKGVIVVPEPASVVLAAAGLAGLAALRRRRPVRARDDR